MYEIRLKVGIIEEKEIIPWDDVKKIPLYNITEAPPGVYQLLQYTGMADKNGNPIYEGDIIQISTGFAMKIGYICFGNFFVDPVKHKGEEVLGFYINFGNSNVTSILNLKYVEEWFFIGNIYDTPEVLKGIINDE